MSLLDWIVLGVTLTFIVGYGIYRSRQQQNLETYLTGGHTLTWWHVCLSVMATQASAVTFLSGPGQAYTDGMRFVQFYFGLPLAMVVISITFIPIFHRLNVYTAYEYLETRFDLKTRTLTALLFLLPRWLSTGISIYAPSIILSTIFGWDIVWTNLAMGGILLIYTVLGGSRAVSYTHVQQMFIVLGGMFLAGYLVVRLLPENMGLVDTLEVAGKMGKLQTINWQFDWNDRYNIWSGLIGGFFLQLSYFGTDQSQVGRYLGGETIGQSRLGLLMNGIVKIPMQFLILLVGALVFVFYQFHQPPLLFNETALKKVEHTAQYQTLQREHTQRFEEKKQVVTQLQSALERGDEGHITSLQQRVQTLDHQTTELRNQTKKLVQAEGGDANDTNYVFLSFVVKYLPPGVVGLLIAIIFIASMGSIASAISSLTSSFVVDIYRRMWVKNGTEAHYIRVSKISTAVWGMLSIAVAMYASRVGSLIEAVNILGSLFYGTVLGVFVVAFYFKSIGAQATFWAAVGAEILVVVCWVLNLTAFLWLNVIGCVAVVGLGLVLKGLDRTTNSPTQD
ncbi:sodium:solute symporter [Siphonobacter sp. BAB-5385]|uniref:sodium:solute symporter n=1 Tax=Siphonobacter sp. BAB-5385 TaxID=1864822 RepID=UPI000B9E936C|nr:sodium:solute symporter [Siphonobacter sp. BAB-5385]OZI05406.1 sodium:solute symporter [Siphonobacter sp. BAB-5385]